MRYTAVCESCPLQVSADTEAALHEAIELLDGGDHCFVETGHTVKQLRRPISAVL